MARETMRYHIVDSFRIHLAFVALVSLMPGTVLGDDAALAGQASGEDAVRFEETDVTAQLKKYLAAPRGFDRRKMSYEELRRYYEKNITSFSDIYPPRTIEPNIDAVLAKYDGERPLTSYDVHYCPFLPIVPEATHELSIGTYTKLKTTIGGREVWGLRFTSSLERQTHDMAVLPQVLYVSDMLYVASLNARALGFTHGQLIPSQSVSVEPAPKFEYNGTHPWSKHSRYKQDDQISRPIELTNNAHPSGDRFDISSHPDFALTATFKGTQPVVMTFYLWKPAAKLLWLTAPPKQGAPPDFVFQFVLERPKA